MIDPPIDIQNDEDQKVNDEASLAQFRAASPQHSVWVSAHAGTGKTRVLTYRVLRLLIDGAEPSEILALTYTRHAASEMRNRIYESIMEWPYLEKIKLIKACKDIGIESPTEEQLERARNLFARLLDATAFLRIETIHAFCQSVLRRFPREAGINPYFRVMEDKQAKQLKETALARTLSQSDDSINDALERLALVRDVNDIMTLMRDMSRYPRLLEQTRGNPQMVKRQIYRYLGCENSIDDPDSIHKLIQDMIHPDAATEALLQRIVQAKSEYGTAAEQKKAQELASWLEADSDQRQDRLLDIIKVFLNGDGDILSRLVTKDVDQNDPDLKLAMETHGKTLINTLKLIHAIDTAQNSFDLIQLARMEFDHYQSLKWQRGMMDYDDLIRMTGRLLNDTSVAWVRFKLDQGIRYLMIDEAQDTSPEQWEIFDQLFEDQLNDQTDKVQQKKPARTVFSVGDYKQSIYSFQGARPDQFVDQGGNVAEKSKTYGRAFEKVDLDTSFRTTAAILDLVDHVVGAKGNLSLLAGVGSPVPHKCHRQEVAGWVHLHHPTRTAEDDETDVVIAHARHIATTISSMIGHIYLPSVERMATAGDILILLRKRDGFYDALHRELQARGIPLAGADRIKLMDDITSLDLIALGEVMLLPEDDLTLAAVLKSPLFGLTEDQLYDLARDRGKTETLFARLYQNPANDDAVAIAYERLLEYMGLAEKFGVHGFYNQVLDMPMRAAFIRRQGMPVLDILGEFLEQARHYETEYTASLLGFLQVMKTDLTDIKRDDDSDVKAVRIMTVHGAKGLESPIVIIPDAYQMKQNHSTLRPVEVPGLADELPLFPAASRYVSVRADAVVQASEAVKQAEEEESHRLLYVAMTRAMDGLLISAFEKPRSRSEKHSWFERIALAMADLGVEPSDNGWFYGAYPDIPDQRAEQITDLQHKDQQDSQSLDLPDWVNRPPAAEPKPPRPVAPSRLSLPQFVGSITGTDRKDAIRRGQIIHRLLETLPNLAPEYHDAASARIINANASPNDSDDTKRDMLHEAQSIIALPELALLFTSQAYAEIPVSGLVGNYAVSGVIDRLVVTDDAVIFVDFKTGQTPDHLADIAPSYITQMGLYTRLLGDIFSGKRIDAGLIYTETPTVFWLPEQVLTDAVKTFFHNTQTTS